MVLKGDNPGFTTFCPEGHDGHTTCHPMPTVPRVASHYRLVLFDFYPSPGSIPTIAQYILHINSTVQHTVQLQSTAHFFLLYLLVCLILLPHSSIPVGTPTRVRPPTLTLTLSRTGKWRTSLIPIQTKGPTPTGMAPWSECPATGRRMP